MKKILLFVLITGLTACGKNAGDNEKPVISLISPTANQQFTAGQTVNITGTITDNDELHEVHVIATNKSTGSELVHIHEHVDAKTYTINSSFLASAGVTYKIHVEADDHVGNTAIVEVEVGGN